MSHQAFLRAAAGLLATTAALASFAAQAQTSPEPQPPTMTDTAPTPPGERSSVGAVILMDEPVLAQRQALQQAMERSAVDTRAMGAGPARLIGVPTKPSRDAQTRPQHKPQQPGDGQGGSAK